MLVLAVLQLTMFTARRCTPITVSGSADPDEESKHSGTTKPPYVLRKVSRLIAITEGPIIGIRTPNKVRRSP